MAVQDPDPSLAHGGGNATAAGVAFQAGVAAYFGAAMLGEKAIDRFSDLGRHRPISIRVETEAPVDDILIETDAGGLIFIQAKTTVDFSSSLASPFGKTVNQFVRQWIACSMSSGGRRWSRPLTQETDRLVLAVGVAASATITRDLALALRAHRAQAGAPLPARQETAFKRFLEFLSQAWKQISGSEADPHQLDAIASLVEVLVFDFGGADRALIVQSMRDVVEADADVDGAFAVLQQAFTALMSTRLGVDAIALRNNIAGSIRLKEPPSFRADVAKLRTYSDQTRRHLEHFEETRIGGEPIKIERKCTRAVVRAAENESILIVGDPGSGKSAVISAAAARLRGEGREVIELAVDRLPVESVEGLQQQLGLTHRLLDVLENWPGNEPAFLFIDALDATRGGRSETVFRWLISEVLKMPRKRWRLVASIRTFDLRMGRQFAELFVGRPPDADYASKSFGSVRHVHIPTWDDDELEELMKRAEPIGQAVAAGGNRLFDLARTPFNTRLLADLLSGGLRPDEFSKVGTQSQLLDLYWANRVDKHGVAAEVCLRHIVQQMVEARSLQVDRLSAATNHAAALEDLLRESVLMTVSGGRYVAFRHHILFDFATSRVYLDLLNPQALADVLSACRSLGLMLGPALIFALSALWLNSNTQRNEFWRAILVCVGRADIDPVVRSIAARVACELPTSREDVKGLLVLLSAPVEERAQAKTALIHVVGSLSVRSEDKDYIAMGPWSYFASELGRVVDQVAWPLRTLLFILTERSQSDEQRSQLGSASRALLRYAFSDAEQLVTAAIGFVGDTYASDPVASRQLLASMFEPSRFDAHGDDDIPWLTRKLDAILAVDHEFVLEIYEKTFARGITDDSETSIGRSRILPLRSNRRQDFQMSYWNLMEFFPKFLSVNVPYATKAYVRAVRGYVLRDHPPRDRRLKYVTLPSGMTCALQEDLSYIWASNPDARHGDNAVEIAQQFSKWLNGASPEEAIAAAETIMSENEMGVVWARLFMVASKRPDVLGLLLWPIATSYPFLWASDTRKDGIDLVAAMYTRLPDVERVAFEESVLAFDFSDAREPEKAREYVLKRLFATIGPDRLRTVAARSFATTTDESRAKDYRNERPVSIEVTSSTPEDYWWLRNEKVNPDASENAGLLLRTKLFNDHLQEQNRTQAFPAVEQAVAELVAFVAEVDAQANAHALVKSYATGVAADGLQVIVSMFERELVGNQPCIGSLIALAVRFSTDPSPEVRPDTEEDFEKFASWGSPAPRIAAAQATIQLASINGAVVGRLRPTLERLLRDSHPAVRMSVASRINVLWFSDRALMWELATRVVNEERNGNVLSFFANGVLGRLIHGDPERVEALIIKLSERSCSEEVRGKIREQIGRLIAILWISHQRPRAKTLIEDWLNDIVTNQEELDHAVGMLRGAVILGYDTGKDIDVQIRRRSIELADWISRAAAANLAVFLANPSNGTAEQEAANAASKLLHHVLNQFYFSSGAFRHGGSNDGEDAGLTSIESKREFLIEVAPILRRITDIGTPQTIHHLIDLLEFLMDADPQVVFDLAANALLGAGQLQGYQFESLGADQVVKLVGRFLADHRGLFDDQERRQTLVRCLDAFIEAGWPAARRLLYRLPELLQ